MAKKKSMGRAVCAMAFAMAAVPALATEGGGLTAYPDGLESFMSGALPPPGVHALVYAGAAHYDKLRDDAGHSAGPPDFKVNVAAAVPRVVWVTQQQVMGGQLAFEALLPLLDVKVTAGGQSWHSTGAADAVVGAAIGWHHSASLHSVAGADVYLPTGAYDMRDPSSLGKHIWTVQPIYAVSLINPAGFNADAKIMWDINGRNSATHTRSGQALHADIDAGWAVAPGWVVGVGGHVFEQFEHDSGPNAALGKSRAMGVGPALRFSDGRALLVTAKLQKEFAVRNRPEGTQLYVKATLPF